MIHCINACPDEYNRPGRVTWMEFQKVSRSEVKARDSNDDGDYGGDNMVKSQTEWLSVEGSVPKFLEHLRGIFESYSPHAYKVQLSNRVRRCEERAFIIDPVAREGCLEEFNDVVSEIVDFTSAIHTKRENNMMCSFPETHNCKVHHLTFSPKFVTVDTIKKIGHKRSAKNLRKRKVDRVLRPENFFFLFQQIKT